MSNLPNGEESERLPLEAGEQGQNQDEDSLAAQVKAANRSLADTGSIKVSR